MYLSAEEVFKPGSELSHKLRSVSDIVRHVKTRETKSESPNYNLFFGAGCSVTSGIRPANELIKEWTKELYVRFNRRECESLTEAENYFEKNHSNWYIKENSYSSLFEKNYDLASQRRRFVESEVEGKLPSIGYAYLASLVSENYFNTIFTTNFDDLINEAFYQFSNERPLLCAHDSSIKSISITSKRPKIIKLHGDYLFDDIKSTVKETESLEQNTRSKLIEFSKEFGLIVVGYSGNDRSIMDVMDFLIKQDNYLKSGIYWCLRKSDQINPTLQNLFWKEKVYPVLIDGFDEFFAEIHSSIFERGLDFEYSQKNSKIQKIKNYILESSNTLNKFIAKDIQAIKKQNSKQEISEFLTNISHNDESRELSDENFRNLLEIESFIKNEDYTHARNRAESLFSSSNSPMDKSRFASMLVNISERNDDKNECLRWCEQLINIDQNNVHYIIKKAKYISDFRERFKYLSDMASRFNHIHDIQNETAITGLNLLKRFPLSNSVSQSDLLQIVDNSLKLNPSLSNSAWDIKLDILLFYSGRPDTDCKELEDEISSLIDKASCINKYSFTYLNLLKRKINYNEDVSVVGSYLNDLYQLYEKSSIYKKEKINNIINDFIESLSDYDNDVEYLDLAGNFYFNHIKDQDIKSLSSLLLGKCKFLVNSNELKKAEPYFESALECKDLALSFGLALSLNKCFDFKYVDDMITLLDDQKSKFYKRYFFEYKHELYIQKRDYTKALEYLDKSYENGLSAKDYFTFKSYLFLLFRKYKELIDFIDNSSAEVKSLASEVVTINYQFAAKKINHESYNKVVLMNLSGSAKKSSDLRLAAFAVMDNVNDAKRILNKKIKDRPFRFYTYSMWPIITPNLLEDVKKNDAA